MRALLRRAGRAGAMRADARAYSIMRARCGKSGISLTRALGLYPSDALHSMDTMRCGKSGTSWTLCLGSRAVSILCVAFDGYYAVRQVLPYIPYDVRYPNKSV